MKYADRVKRIEGLVYRSQTLARTIEAMQEEMKSMEAQRMEIAGPEPPSEAHSDDSVREACATCNRQWKYCFAACCIGLATQFIGCLKFK